MNDNRRPSAAKRGYDRQWRKARRAYLARHQLCVRCKAAGRIAPASDVDHIVPHRGDKKLLRDPTNRQPLCKSCHSRHKQREERRGYSSAAGPDGWPVDPRHPANRGTANQDA